jgi:Flp pilus assembly protein TadB
VPLLFLPTLVAGVVAAAVVPLGTGVVLSLTVAGTLAVGTLARGLLRRARRARRIRRELLANPEPFVDAEPPRHLLRV